MEDSRADAELLVAMLELELPGALIEVSATVAEAVPLLQGPLDIAITDLSLPDAEDLQALSAILSARPDIAVVVLTGRQDRALALQALSAGAEDYLVKGASDARAIATAVLYAAQRRSAETKSRRYERLALSLLDAMEAATCAVDGAGNIIATNQAWRHFAESNRGDAARTGVGMNYFDVCGAVSNESEDTGVAQQIATGLRALLAGQLTRFERDYPCHRPNEQRWFSVRINALPESGAVVTHVDITSAKKAAQALTHLSLHDSLTNLPNRHLLVDRLTHALAWAHRLDQSVAVAFLDLDQFKRINDSLGHAAGDQLLCEVARRLSAHIRQGDTVARFAGDEFVVVWPNVRSGAEAEQLAARLSESLAAPFALDAAIVTVTASVGITIGRQPQVADELLLDADAAMYDAKRHGRGRTRIYTEELRESGRSKLRVEAELRRALEREEFVLYYQPVVDLLSGEIKAVEALVRWQHPEGLRMPDTFIPIAEATGLIVPLGIWVLREACRQGAAWHAAGLDLDIAVNFSARQIGHPGIISDIKNALYDSGMPADRLLAEVTESIVLEDAELARATLEQIRSLGAAIAIDDFGTGYSSLLYLKRYPVAALKIDRQFVAGMGKDGDDDAIVASVVSLARAVGAVCIAEGVETEDQLESLRALSCRYAQGYLFGRPASIDDLPETLRRCQALLDRHRPAQFVPFQKCGVASGVVDVPASLESQSGHA